MRNKQDLLSLLTFLGVWVFMMIIAQISLTPLFKWFQTPYHSMNECMTAILDLDKTKDKVFFLCASIFQSLVGTIGAIFVFIRVFLKKPINSYLQLRNSPSIGRIGWFLLFLLLSYPTISVIYYVNMALVHSDQSLLLLENKLIGSEEVYILGLNTLLFGFLAGFGEECMYRGIIQQKIAKMVHPALAIVYTSIIFTVMHFQWEGIIPRFLISCFFGYIFHISRNLWYPIILHIVFNLTQVFYMYITSVLGSEIEFSPDQRPIVYHMVFLVISWILLYLFIHFKKDIFKIKNESTSTS